MRSEVLTDEIPKNTPKLREEVQMWLKHKKIQGFYDVLQVSDSHQDANFQRILTTMIFPPEQELCRRSRCLHITQVENHSD